MDILYETWEVVKILQLSQRRIINWVERGFIAPAKEGKGPGIRRKYSFDNLIQMKLIDELTAFKISLPGIKMVFLLFDKSMNAPNPLSSWEIFYNALKIHLKKYRETGKWEEETSFNRYLIVKPSRDERTKEEVFTVSLVSKLGLKNMIDKDLSCRRNPMSILHPLTGEIKKKFVESSAFLVVDLVKITDEVEQEIEQNL